MSMNDVIIIIVLYNVDSDNLYWFTVELKYMKILCVVLTAVLQYNVLCISVPYFIHIVKLFHVK